MRLVFVQYLLLILTSTNNTNSLGHSNYTTFYRLELEGKKKRIRKMSTNQSVIKCTKIFQKENLVRTKSKLVNPQGRGDGYEKCVIFDN